MANKSDPQRLRRLELILKWEGRVGNARMRELFELSSIRASQWIRELRESHPGWTRWNRITRSFDVTFEFYEDKSSEEASSLSQYLALVGLPSAMVSNLQNVVVAGFPEIATPNPQIFAVLSQAARIGKAVEITYRSMREPAPHKRTISPHSIVRAGPHWHARAYCELNKQFHDYALGRIVQAQMLQQPAGALMKDDKDWLTEVPVRLIAHPELSREQESIIRFEFFKDTSARVTTCRGPLVSYFIQDVHAAVDLEKQRPPEYQLAVGNAKEIRQWLFPR